MSVGAGETVLRLRLNRALDTHGYACSDFHVHSAPSFDSDVPLDQRLIAALAEGLDAFAPTDHETVGDWQTEQAMLNMRSFAAADGSLARLAGVTWGAEDLSAAIGAVSNREEDGSFSPLYILAQSLCLCAAAASGVPPMIATAGAFSANSRASRSMRSALTPVRFATSAGVYSASAVAFPARSFEFTITCAIPSAG